MRKPQQRRNFGKVQQQRSGRWQASYVGSDGERVYAPTTFRLEREADDWLSGVRSDRIRGVLRQPKGNKKTLTVYAPEWLEHRPKPLAPNSLRNYANILDKYILPELGHLALTDIDKETVRKWHVKVARLAAASAKANNRTSDGSAVQAASYRLLRAILTTAFDDDLITHNPCNLKKASVVDRKPRGYLSADVRHKIADLVNPRYKVVVLLCGFAGMRVGEVLGLQRGDIDLDEGTITITRQLQRVSGKWVTSKPKSKNGTRVIYLPDDVLTALRVHLVRFVDHPASAPALRPVQPMTDWLFLTSRGGHVYRGDILKMVKKVAENLGLEHVFPHLLRHAALTDYAVNGATNAELMDFGGHSDIETAMLYQHSATERKKALAKKLSFKAA